EVLEMASAMVARAKGYAEDVEFSPMDATRSDREYVYTMLQEVIEAGATTVNIPDTVGYTVPEEFEEFIKAIFENVSNIHKATVSVHCHNDLGMAVANSLAAVRAGARTIEVCVNGIGERAGNASLEEVVMAIRTRPDFFDMETNINSKEIYRTSRLVERLTGMSLQPNKAIVGTNAFRHQSGIHQDGILKMRETYEIMDAKDIGWPSGAEIVLGKTSGRHGFKARLEALGYELSEEELSRAFLGFKELADKKQEIDDRDLEALVADKKRTSVEVYHLDFVQVMSGDHATPTATVRLISPDGSVLADAALGTGPVDAIYKAINRIINVPNQLTEFSVKSVTEGIDAQGEVTIRIESDGRSYVGRGADTDIMVASAKAYMNALNRLLSIQRRADSEVRTSP
ncbi:MAG: 2-isopropylmalate synthase, partial [Chloroflexi bacterium]|nr:2-isopropylmalate synthase [Chloroflexota bacterium]